MRPGNAESIQSEGFWRGKAWVAIGMQSLLYLYTKWNVHLPPDGDDNTHGSS